MPFDRKVKLRYAIGLLVLMTVILTAGVSWYSATNALKHSLAENYLESNRNYANKLSLSTSDLLIHMQEHINGIAVFVGRQSFSQDILDSYRITNSSYFSALLITDPNGVIQVISPSVVRYNKGPEVKANTKLVSNAIQNALELKRPLISEPYNDLSGQRVLLVSAPIFDNNGSFKGLVAGTINLEGENVIKNTLDKHQYANGSYVYVVDQKGRIIFHPDPSRINDIVTKNEAVRNVLQGKSGSAQVVNTQGNEFYAGYAFEKVSGWGIISQTPTGIIAEPLGNVRKSMFFQGLPLLLLILLLASVLANNLSRPLNVIAKHSENAIHENKIVRFEKLKINSHIFEVHHLYHHMNNYLNLLNRQIEIDGLTGLSNRKAFDSIMKEWVEKDIAFSIILLDIDRFKRVNDTFGHLVGDDVLRYLAGMINSVCKNEMYCFRYGGEEFVILMKNKNIESAFEAAEQLREKIAETASPTGEAITISLGITEYQKGDKHPEEIIERADSALYQSKTDGRNRTTVFHNKVKTFV
ncbi:sensor domain-containing diguanylate cyclase [Calidifontibacillus oryziterrae]|uniref:sensor domain-containing diguanylate cyclase n=1 Tax=Calidifontibacillus oryziterrae TaxID=1191699 RepID=UPI0002F9DABC|nr:sensor domain-containing diguanylate cyclase [Calidifontibacillus oryziterrae]